MSHANARLTPAGRLIMVRRIAAGRPVAHVAAEMGVSRTTAWRWWRRFQAEGRPGLVDRPSVARTHPRRTPACVETRVRIARMLTRRGPLTISRIVGCRPRPWDGSWPATVSALAQCDPVTGQVIRATRRSANRYEHPYPGSLVHVDVKKLGRIPDGGGWRAHGRSEQVRGRGIGYDYVHAAIDDHSRLAYVEIHDDEKTSTCARFLTNAAAYFAAHGIARIERVITDNAFAYRPGTGFAMAVARLGARQKFIRPHCPGPTARPKDSTGPSPPNGPTPASGPRTPNAPRPCPDGSSTTT